MKSYVIASRKVRGLYNTVSLQIKTMKEGEGTDRVLVVLQLMLAWVCCGLSQVAEAAMASFVTPFVSMLLFTHSTSLPLPWSSFPMSHSQTKIQSLLFAYHLPLLC